MYVLVVKSTVFFLASFAAVYHQNFVIVPVNVVRKINIFLKKKYKNTYLSFAFLPFVDQPNHRSLILLLCE